MLCNLWCSLRGYGITSITRYHWVPVFPFLLSQPLYNLEPMKKEEKKKKRKVRRSSSSSGFSVPYPLQPGLHSDLLL